MVVVSKRRLHFGIGTPPQLCSPDDRKLATFFNRKPPSDRLLNARKQSCVAQRGITRRIVSTVNVSNGQNRFMGQIVVKKKEIMYIIGYRTMRCNATERLKKDDSILIVKRSSLQLLEVRPRNFAHLWVDPVQLIDEVILQRSK